MIPSEHTSGVEFFRSPDLGSVDNAYKYFQLIENITPLLKSSDFKESTPGFYLNQITNVEDDVLNSLRLTYYTTNPIKTLETIQAFMDQNSEKVKLFQSKWTGKPEPMGSFSTHSEEEIAFRNFASINNSIALDLLENVGQAQLQLLVCQYRYVYLPSRISPKIFLENILMKLSKTYRELKKLGLDDQYWSGLVKQFHNNTIGLHLLVNFSLIKDLQEVYPYYSYFFEKDWFIH